MGAVGVWGAAGVLRLAGEQRQEAISRAVGTRGVVQLAQGFTWRWASGANARAICSHGGMDGGHATAGRRPPGWQPAIRKDRS